MKQISGSFRIFGSSVMGIAELVLRRWGFGFHVTFAGGGAFLFEGQFLCLWVFVEFLRMKQPIDEVVGD